MQTSKECTLRAIEFRNPDRIPVCISFDDKHELDRQLGVMINSRFDGDIMICGNDDPDFKPGPDGVDQWGCVWSSMGHTMGEVIGHPLENWDSFENWLGRLPDFKNPRRYEAARKMRSEYPEKFLIGGLGMLMENIINFRGFENYMTDFYLEQDNLSRLIDAIYSSAYDSIEMFAAAGMDAVIAWEDWGLQDRELLNPGLWRDIFKEKMRRMVEKIHSLGMKYMLHCCGYILNIFDDLMEMGVDVIQLDQQKNMGLDVLRERWRGKICFWCPIDIQYVSGNQDIPAVLAYGESLLENLSTPAGGFMYKCYAQPEAIQIPVDTLMAEVRFFKNALQSG